MKKLLSTLVIALGIMTLFPAGSMAAKGEIFDFSNIDFDSAKSLPATWGSLGGSRKSEIKSGKADLISEKKYLEITNDTKDGAWATPPVFPCSQQFKDYVNIADGETLLMSAAVMIEDMNFTQVGLYAPRANITYIDAEGNKGSLADVDFAAGIPLLAICCDNGMVWLNSWGNDITPENFDFELNRFYKLDVMFRGGENKMDVFLDGKNIDTVDYTSNFAKMSKNNVAYDFTDTTKYRSFKITQVKRLSIAQHKPKTTKDNQVCGWYGVGYVLYGTSDVVPGITFKENDLTVNTASELVTEYVKDNKLIMKQKSAKASDVSALFSGSGTVKLYKDKASTKPYNDDEWISYPAYMNYYDQTGFKAVELPLVTDFYMENTQMSVKENVAEITGKMINLGNEANEMIIIIAGYSDYILKNVKMQTIQVDAQGSKAVNLSVTIDDDCDEVLAWTIDNWKNRNVLSDIYKIDL